MHGPGSTPSSLRVPSSGPEYVIHSRVIHFVSNLPKRTGATVISTAF